jgi:PAS domain S-box-containing protein
LIVSDDADVVRRLTSMGQGCLFAPDPTTAVMEASAVIARNWRGLKSRLGAIPMLAITDDADAALSEGACEVLAEPFSDALLSVRLHNVMNSARQAAPSSEPGGAKDLLPRLLEACPDPVIAADLRGRVLVFSGAAERLLGYTHREALQLHVDELFAQAGDARRVMAAMREDPDQTVVGQKIRLRSLRGEAIEVLLSAALVHDFAGRPVASVGLFRDDRINRSLASRLAAATDQLVASEKRAAAVAVAGATAHELNQPLTAAMGLLELALLDAARDGHAPDRIERAHRQLYRMKDIVSRLSGVRSYRTTDYVGEEILDL